MVPTFNPNPKYLEETLMSILAEDPGPREMQIELVDDGSQNFNPEAFLADRGMTRVSAFRHPQRKGIGGNWNSCLERSRGQWIHLLHQDDVVMPGFYARMRMHCEGHPEIGAAICHNFVMDSAGARTLHQSRIPADQAGVLTDWMAHVFEALSFLMPGIIVKRSVYEELGGFDTSYDYALDWDMWKRLAARFPIWYEPQPLVAYRRHRHSETSRLMRTGRNIAEIARSIRTSRAYLPPNVAADVTRRANAYYLLYAVKKAEQLYDRRDAKTAFIQLCEACQLDSSAAVVREVARLVGRRVRSDLSRRFRRMRAARSKRQSLPDGLSS
jgi:glycosyltransferase involved in cell wall biosynthesis